MARYWFDEMLPMGAFEKDPMGRITLFKKNGGAPPDYTPVANASAGAAVLGKQLGDAQLAEAQRQYNNDLAVAQPVVQAQLGLMAQQQQQGDDYFNYMKTNSRPVEQQLYYEAMGFTPDEVAQINRLPADSPQIAQFAATAKARTDAMDKTERDGITSLANTQANDTKNLATDFTNNQDAAYANLKDTSLANANTLANNTAAYTTDQKALADQLAGQKTANSQTLTDRTANYETNANGDIQLVTGGNQGIQDKYAADISHDINNAVADTRNGQTSAVNTALRQAMRYGKTLPAEADVMTSRNAQALAAAANNTRDSSTANYRNIVANGINLKRDAFMTGQSAMTDALNRGESATQGQIDNGQTRFVTGQSATTDAMNRGENALATNIAGSKDSYLTQSAANEAAAAKKMTALTTARSSRIQDSAIGTAKKLDAAGLFKGLTGASQGAYGLSLNAGNAAVNNNQQAGNQLLNANQGAAGTIMQGSAQNLSGLGNILNAQTSVYNASQSGSDGLFGAVGTLGGAAISHWSDKNLKKDIEPIDDNAALEGINKTEISKWKYDATKAKEGQVLDDKEHIGGMAQDLQKNLGDQVSDGKMVDIISAVGVSMAATKALSKKVDKLIKKSGSKK